MRKVVNWTYHGKIRNKLITTVSGWISMYSQVGPRDDTIPTIFTY